MVIEKISIKNFRNLEKIVFFPTENINYIVGDNAQGKTNIIEAIYFLTYLKSFRTNETKNLYNISNKFEIDATIYTNKVKYFLSVSSENKTKKIILNNNRINVKKISDFLNIILYYPSEINLLLKFPSYRRNLIDKSIYIYNPDYVDLHNKYIKCVKNRNICLKNNKDDYVWREKLIDLSFYIIRSRLNFILKINDLLKSLNIYEKEKYSISYKTYDITNIKNEMSKHFENVEKYDRKNGYTSIGPHVENIDFNLNNKNINIYGSEGQKKTFLLFYKYAQLLDYKSKKKDYPVFLVDDLTSELDKSRETLLLKEILSNCKQSFITSNIKPHSLSDNTGVFHVEEGMIS